MLFSIWIRTSSFNQVEPILTENDYGRGRSVWGDMRMVARVQSKVGWCRVETIEEVATHGVDRHGRLDRRHIGLATRGSRSRSDDLITHRKN